ncbi:MAG: DUF2079 domain-containing protein [Elusimicrobiota bacterium]
MSSRGFIRAFLGASIFIAFFFYVSFYRDLFSLASEWTGSGFIWPLQLFHNFLNGRAFQSSMCASLACGASVGFSFNPHAFIHANVIHVNLTPYLFAPLWGLNPTPAWMYGIQAIWSLGGGLWFARSILRRLDPDDWRGKFAFASAVLLSSGLLSILNQLAQFLIFAGPMMLAMYDAALAKSRWRFAAWTIALCLVTEDAALVSMAFGAYFWLFERRRQEGALAAGLGFAWLALIFIVVQPASRAELTLTHGLNIKGVLSHIFSITPALLVRNIFSLIPALTLLPALGLGAAVFRYGRGRRGWIGIAALAVLPALPHWGESGVVGGAHHLITPFWGCFLALLRLIGDARGRGVLSGAAWAWAAVYALVSFRALVGNLPLEFKLPLLRVLRPAQARVLARGRAAESASNAAVQRAVAAIPKNDSLVYLGNIRATGLVFDRSDVWEFPDQYDRVRYILIQKDACDVNFVLRPEAGETLSRAIERTATKENVREQVLEPAVIALIRRDLEKTHRIALENESVLLLENRNPRTPSSPPTTIGLGWLKNLGRRGELAR